MPPDNMTLRARNAPFAAFVCIVTGFITVPIAYLASLLFPEGYAQLYDEKKAAPPMIVGAVIGGIIGAIVGGISATYFFTWGPPIQSGAMYGAAAGSLAFLWSAPFSRRWRSSRQQHQAQAEQRQSTDPMRVDKLYERRMYRGRIKTRDEAIKERTWARGTWDLDNLDRYGKTAHVWFWADKTGPIMSVCNRLGALRITENLPPTTPKCKFCLRAVASAERDSASQHSDDTEFV